MIRIVRHLFTVAFTLAAFCTVALRAQEQFVPLTPPYGGNPTHIESAPNGTIFLFSDRYFRLLRSTDRGDFWSILQSGLPSGSAGEIHVMPDGTVYLAMISPQGLFRSTDNGDSWTQLTSPPGRIQLTPLFANDATGALYMAMGAGDGEDGRLHRSTDRGVTWTPIPSIGEVRSLAVASDGALLAVQGNEYGGKSIHRSTDRGVTWSEVLRSQEHVENFLEVLAGPGGHAWAIADDGYHGIPYYSGDNGTTWDRAPSLEYSYSGGAHQSSDGRLLLGTQLAPRTLYRYGRNGSDWRIEKLSPGMNGTHYEYSPVEITTDGTIYAGFGGMVLRSDDDGATWNITGATGGGVNSIAIDSQDGLYAGLQIGGVMQSTNRGAIWHLINTGLADTSSGTATMFDRNGNLFVVTSYTVAGGSGLYRSSDKGTTWVPSGPAGVKDIMMIFPATNGDLFLSRRHLSHTGEVILYRSADAGASWTELPPVVGEIEDIEVNYGITMADRGNGSLYLLSRNSLHRSTDRGDSWTLLKTFPINPSLPSLLIAASGDLLVTGDGKLERSTDDGATWTIEPGTPGDPFLFDKAQLLAVAPGGEIWMNSPARKLQISYDHGRSWQLASNIDGTSDIEFAKSGDIYIVAGGIVLRGRNNGAWSRTAQTSGKQILSLAAGPDDLIFTSAFNNAVSLSRNNGDQWFDRGIGLPQSTYSILVQSEQTMLAGTNGGIFRTTDGVRWNHVPSAISPTMFVHALVGAISGTTFAGTFGGGVYRSTNQGSEWSARNNGLGNLFVKGLALGGDGRLFAATNGGVYRSMDEGEAWSLMSGNLPGGFFANVVLYREGAYLLAGTKGGIYRSTDEGASWSQANLSIPSDAEVRALFRDASGSLWAGCDAGVFSSRDEGVTWEPAGLGDKDVRAFTENSRYMFAGTTTDGVYRMAKGVASADFPGWEHAGTAMLHVAPNPFSGPALFTFSIPHSGRASIDLYDGLGRRLSTLLDADLSEGEHQLVWNPNLAPGAYYSVLTCGAYRAMRKILVMGEKR